MPPCDMRLKQRRQPEKTTGVIFTPLTPHKGHFATMATFLCPQGGCSKELLLYPCDLHLKHKRQKQLKSTILPSLCNLQQVTGTSPIV